MKYTLSKTTSLCAVAPLLFCSSIATATDISDALSTGKASGNFRLRYESVDQDNAADDATALTFRSRLGYKTGDVNGFSAMLEFEDVRIVGGQSDYTVGPTGFNPGEYSVIADPEFTELDQGFVQYRNDNLTAKVGRQVITYDGHRFVGHVGWRQDRQTFDGLTVKYSPVKNLTLNYGYIDQRNRIFAEVADVDAKDHLLNAAYKTDFGTFVAYGYLLEIDTDADNSIDTFGVRYSGSSEAGDVNILYAVELASQESDNGTQEYDANYMLLEGGAKVAGITAKLGYEVLGSDGGDYGFQTPLATLHKFNGWADQFLSTPSVGLVDVSATVSYKFDASKVALVYHNFEADDASDTVDDLGKEIDVVYTQKFGKLYSGGIKYAAYSEGDKAAGKVDADKLWVWLEAAF